MSRKEFSKKTQRLAFARCHVEGVPRCEGRVPLQRQRCNADLRNKPFEYDHDDADYFSRDNSLENCVVLCVLCHKEKTIKVDLPKIVKARSIYRTQTRTKPTSRPIPGSKASGLKHKMDGTWERRS